MEQKKDACDKLPTFHLDIAVYPSEMKTYGKEGLKELAENIIDRYFTEEYFDPDIVADILKRDKCPHCGIPLVNKMFDIDGTNLSEHAVCPECGYGTPALL